MYHIIITITILSLVLSLNINLILHFSKNTCLTNSQIYTKVFILSYSKWNEIFTMDQVLLESDNLDPLGIKHTKSLIFKMAWAILDEYGDLLVKTPNYGRGRVHQTTRLARPQELVYFFLKHFFHSHFAHCKLSRRKKYSSALHSRNIQWSRHQTLFISKEMENIDKTSERKETWSS